VRFGVWGGLEAGQGQISRLASLQGVRAILLVGLSKKQQLTHVLQSRRSWPLRQP